MEYKSVLLSVCLFVSLDIFTCNLPWLMLWRPQQLLYVQYTPGVTLLLTYSTFHQLLFLYNYICWCQVEWYWHNGISIKLSLSLKLYLFLHLERFDFNLIYYYL